MSIWIEPQPTLSILLSKRRNPYIRRAMLTKDPDALHYFVSVWLEDTPEEKPEIIHFRNIQYSPPPAEEVIGMSIPAAKKFLKQDDERAKHE